jgi:undecaprenyl diphosphate synthase
MKPLLQRVKERPLPRHVAIIMDGNGRWATARGLPRTAGHQAGAHATERLIRFVGERLGLEYVTLFAFSSENWQRPRDEVDFLMDLLERFIEEKLREFTEAGIRLRVIGDVGSLPDALRRLVARAVEQTAGGSNLCLTIALSYGARQELVRACARIVEEAVRGGLEVANLTEEDISSRLFTAGVPDPDLIIRTSGEMRLSNFLLWQSAYAELWFTDVLWPDFSPAELVRAIDDFQRRQRRYGALVEGDR